MQYISVLDWDTEFFGFRVGQIIPNTLSSDTWNHINQEAISKEIKCLYFYADAQDIQTPVEASKHGFLFVDFRISFSLPILSPPQSEPKAGILVRHATPSDAAGLKLMAKNAFLHSRYYYDPGFDKDSCDCMYQTWIENSLTGQARDVLVVEANSKLAGFITLHVDDAQTTGRIGLICIDKDFRGKGLGRELIIEGIKWCCGLNLKKLTVVTQGRNIDAQRLYQNSGFRSETVGIYYHKWY